MARLQCTVCRSLRLPASRRAPSLTRSVKGPWVHSGSGNEPAARPSSRPCSANWPRVSHAPPLDAPFGLAFHQSHPEMAAERAGDRRKVRRDGAGETRAGWRMGEPSRCCQRMAFIEALTRRHRELNNVAFGPKHPPSPDCRFFSERSGTQTHGIIKHHHADTNTATHLFIRRAHESTCLARCAHMIDPTQVQMRHARKSKSCVFHVNRIENCT